jgi:hypothetical protein
MAITFKAKWEGGYYDATRQAIVLMEDGIWRVCRGKIKRGYSNEAFYFVYEGMIYCADSNSFREIDVSTPEDEVYMLVCDYNMGSLARDIEIKKIMKKHANLFGRNNTPAIIVDETGVTQNL